MTEEEQKIVDDCDLIFWYRQDEHTMNSKYIRSHSNIKRAKKTDLGYKYNILLFKENQTAEHAEFFSAIIGDEMGYVERMGGSGYSGLMFRSKTHRINVVKKTLFDLLSMFGFTDKEVRKYLREAQ